MQILNTYSHWTGGGVSWVAAMVRLHRIRTGSVEKGRGLKPVTSVAVASPLTAFRRARQRRRSRRSAGSQTARLPWIYPFRLS